MPCGRRNDFRTRGTKRGQVAHVENGFLIEIEPSGRRIRVAAGTNLLEAIQSAGVDLVAACGGIGVCGSCRIRVMDGELSPLTENEKNELPADQLALGYRLACQARPLGDARVFTPPESLPMAAKWQLDGVGPDMPMPEGETGAVHWLDVAVAEPTLEDGRSDAARVQDAIGPFDGRAAEFSRLSRVLRRNGWRARLVMRDGPKGKLLVAVLPPETRPLGLAVDVGSTKVALYLVDLESGASLATAGDLNPQGVYGQDVVSRIAFANRSEENRRLLQTRLAETLNRNVAALCATAGVEAERVVDAVLAGNTVMHHLLCGLPVEQLGASPYVASVSGALDLHAGELGLAVAPGARAYLPPLIAGYVGADHVAALLASLDKGITQILVDIGTNTEISLSHNGHISACSTASGPAFEGTHIRDGMRAAPGAIERVRIVDGAVRVWTIDGRPAAGICGTGILTALSSLLGAGWMDRRGHFLQGHPRVRGSGRESEFLLVPAGESAHGRDVAITRDDAHAIQLAKAAIRAGIEILLAETGIGADQVDQWGIAGAFGACLDIGGAQAIGMFPRVPVERFRQLGNAAGMGAKRMLLSSQSRREADNIVARTRYIDLTIHPDFTNVYTDNLYFPKND
jgi:uncharacterized 2Fe-2S/4Fe-4S cluster protein (DUF4445 family)